VGLGYAYGNTDIKDDSRKIDVDSNTLFVYGKYQPNQWYVNSMLAYSWSDYEEKKSITGIDAGAKYDVDTISVQSILGYETQYAGYDITPEVGFRYIHSELDNYRDKLGTQVASRDADVFTLVLGPKIAKDYTFENGYIIRPELRAAITYDLFTDNNNYLVTLANGAAYQVDGEKMARFGYELGAKITAFSNNNWDILAGYTARLRDEYNDNTYMLEAKYHF
jgi:outer membrane autotransporter protein